LYDNGLNVDEKDVPITYSRPDFCNCDTMSYEYYH